MLSVILGCTQILEDRVSDPGVIRRLLAQIEQPAQNAASLTRQLLAYSMQQVLEPQVLDLNAVAKKIEPLVRRLIREDIDFQTVLKPQLGLVKVEPGQIEQVIMNQTSMYRIFLDSGH